MNNIQICTIVALCIYAIIMALIGCVSFGKSKNLDGFLIGNRKMNAWVSAFAYGTTYFSAVVFVGYAGQHGWNTGVGAIWIGVGNAVLGCLISWLFFAKRARNMTQTLKAKTMPEFFKARYQSTSMKIFAAVIIFVFLVPYSAAVYKGLGSLFNAIFPGVPTWVWMLVIAVLVSIYLVVGGYVATAYTDLVQGIIMIVGVIAMIIAIFSRPEVTGGAGFFENLKAIPMDEGGVDGAQLTNIFGGKAFSALCFNIMLTSFGTWGLPQMVSKFYAIKKEPGAIKRATIISTIFCVIIGCGAYLIGTASRLVLNNTLPAGGVDSVIPEVLMKTLGEGKITIVLLAIIVVLLLSASMSTLEAVVLTSASAVAVDFIPTVKKNVKPETQMVLTRVLCLVFVACSFIFATQNIPIIVNLMSFSWGVVSGCFIGPFIWGLFSKKITKVGAYAGMISGIATVAIATLVITLTNPVGFDAAAKFSPQMGVSAMAVSMVVVPVVSMFTKKFSDEHNAKCFALPSDEE